MLKNRVLVIPDTQIPNHNKQSWKVVLEFAKFYKPTEVIIIGDFIDLNSLSHYQRLSAKENETLDQEIEAGNVELDRLEKVTKQATKRVYLLGNHEYRYEIYKLNNWCQEVRHLRKLTTVEDELRLKERGYEVIPYGGIYQKGHAIFTHGWHANKYHAEKTLRRFFKNIYYGHSHNWQVHSMIGLDGQPVESVSIGCLCNNNLDYLRGKPSDWVQMFMYSDFLEDGSYYPHFPKIINGKTVEYGRMFK